MDREDSEARTDYIWVGIQAATPDGVPHVGRVVGRKNQWVLAGFNGGGMALIATSARAIAKMVTDDLGFEDVQEEFGLPEGFKTSAERTKGDTTKV